jgi:tetratricopeptide (TPR) repeat protein/S1-C subfamily serine protease
VSMLSHPLLRLMTTVCSLYALSLPTVVLSPRALSAEKIAPLSGQSSPQQMKELAKAFTVKVFAGQQRGSGVILAKNGQRYTVVTNAHVIDRGKPYRIQTSDGKTYMAVLKSKGDTFKGSDLAVLEFSAAANYQVAQWGNSGAIKGAEPLFAVGFPEGENQLLVSTGQVSLIVEKALLGGYRIGFSNETRQGMSGGALLNAQGKVIGILGQGNQAILERAYTYQDGSKPTAKVLQQMRESSFAVPIATVRQMVPPAKIAQTPLPPPPGVPSVPPWNPQLPSIPIPMPTPSKPNQVKPTYTGVLGEVDKIAEQITVRIQGKEHGSGVIVAKQGNTYTVLTAAHVLSKPDTYSIITSDGKQHEINLAMAKFQRGIDLAVVQFNSSNAYQVATLGTAQLNNETRVFVSGFPTEQLPRRVITTGKTVKREVMDLAAKESYSLAEGVGLLYTNMPYEGMSGGPVLDTQGRVIAINWGAEDYNFLVTGKEPSEVLNLGYSLGVPISSFVGLSNQFSVQLAQLMVERTKPIKLAETEHELITVQLVARKDPGESGTAMDWLSYGNQLFRQEDYGDVILACERAIQLKPDFYHAYYLKGLALGELLDIGKFTEAMAALDKVTQISPSFYPAWRWKGILLNQLNKYSEALLAYQKAIQAQGNNFTLYIEQGDVLKDLRRYEEAINSYSKGINLNPHLLAGYNNRGITYSTLKQYDKAFADFNKAIVLQPDSTLAYINRGNTYSTLKQYDKAFADFNKAIALQPDSTLAYIYRGITYNNLKQYDKAIVDYSKVIALQFDYTLAQILQPDSTLAYINRGNIYSTLKQYDKAFADFNKVIALQPDFAETYKSRGNIYSTLKQYDKALVDFNKAINLNPDLADAYNVRGGIYAALKQYDKALVDLNKAIGLNPDLAEAYTSRGATYYFLKQYDKALVDFNKAIAINPDLAIAHSNRGETYSALKQYDKALVDLQKAIALNPDLADAYNIRGNTYSALKQYDKAMQDFQKAYLLAQQQGDTATAQAAKQGIELLQKQK